MFTQKNIDNYRSESVEQRVNKVTRELLLPSNKTKRVNNLYTITSNTSITSTKSPNLKSENQLQKRISLLQNELKRKISEDSIMKHLFKTKTPLEISHLDLYLEIRRLQDRISQLSQNQKDYVTRLQQLQEELKQQEELHMENVQQISDSLTLKQKEWTKEKSKLNDDGYRLKEASQNNRFLLEEMKKKNAQLMNRNKQIIEETSIQRDALNLSIIKLKSEYESIIVELKKVSNQSKCSTEETEKLQLKVREMSEDLQAYKDQNERLYIKMEELQHANQQLTQNFIITRKEEQQKFTTHYEKLRKDYEIQIQTLIQGHQQLMQNQRKENLELKEKNKITTQQSLILKKSICEKQRLLAQSQQKIGDLQRRLAQFNSEKQTLLQNNSKLAREIKQLKFDSKQIIESKQKTKFQLNDLRIVNQKLSKRIIQLQQQQMALSNKNLQLKKQIQYSQSYHKLNDKVYNQNYKTLGRIIEINHKIKHQLLPDSEIVNKGINQESLTEVVSYLTEILQQYISIVSNQKRARQQNARERNIQNRQIISVLQQLKNYLNYEIAQILMNKYISFLKDRKSAHNQQNHQRIQAYHQLIECLMNLHSLKCYSSDNTHQPTIEKDSLDNTLFLKNVESSKKFMKNSIQRQSSGKNLKNNLGIERESSVYDMPLKRKLLVSEQDKQNVNINIAKGQDIGKRESTKKYLHQVRERLSNKIEEKCKDKEQFRSQVYKKYFRS